ncbi:hypothetical protein C8R45DRAFT_1005698 [Mycena sanguinolenta]|nr:hypothetical protein C8R45DRAFT_1005698 [Mycena sanguinolenta]
MFLLYHHSFGAARASVTNCALSPLAASMRTSFLSHDVTYSAAFLQLPLPTPFPPSHWASDFYLLLSPLSSSRPSEEPDPNRTYYIYIPTHRYSFNCIPYTIAKHTESSRFRLRIVRSYVYVCNDPPTYLRCRSMHAARTPFVSSILDQRLVSVSVVHTCTRNRVPYYYYTAYLGPVCTLPLMHTPPPPPSLVTPPVVFWVFGIRL